MYSHKNLKCGFVILCPEHNVSLLKCTMKSIQCRYPNLPMICATDNSATAADIKEMKVICPTFKGKSTFSSLINTGMKNAPAEWNFILCAGVTVDWKMDDRFAYFTESEKDILFPIVEKKTNFVDATLNGLFINKKTWKEVGNMENEGTLEECKILWATKAIEKGVKFKAIAGSKIC
jgi:hypothetical protein